MGFGIERAGHCRDTVGLGTAGIHCHGHCRDTVGLGTAGILYAVERCRHTLRLLLGSAGIFGGRALQGYLMVGHCRDTWWLGTVGILCGWELQGYVAIEHCSQASRGGRGQHRLLNSNNPTARVGKEGF